MPMSWDFHVKWTSAKEQYEDLRNFIISTSNEWLAVAPEGIEPLSKIKSKIESAGGRLDCKAIEILKERLNEMAYNHDSDPEEIGRLASWIACNVIFVNPANIALLYYLERESPEESQFIKEQLNIDLVKMSVSEACLLSSLAALSGDIEIVKKILVEKHVLPIFDVGSFPFSLTDEDIDPILKQPMFQDIIGMIVLNPFMDSPLLWAVENGLLRSAETIAKTMRSQGMKEENLYQSSILPMKSLKHSHFIKLGQELGYSLNDNGLCMGMVIMWQQAFLQGDEGIKEFNERLKLLSEIPEDAIVKEIYWIKLRLDSGVSYDSLSKREKILYSVKPFYEGIELGLMPYKYPELFSPQAVPLKQDLALSASMIVPKKLEQLGGVSQVSVFGGSYTKDTIQNVFSYIQEKLAAESWFREAPYGVNFHISGMVGDGGHSISMGLKFNVKTNMTDWYFFDVNSLPAKRVQDTEKAVSKIMSAFGKENPDIVLFIKPFCVAQDFNNFAPIIKSALEMQNQQMFDYLLNHPESIPNVIFRAILASETNLLEKLLLQDHLLSDVFSVYPPELLLNMSMDNTAVLSLLLNCFHNHKVWPEEICPNASKITDPKIFELLLQSDKGVLADGIPKDIRDDWGSVLVDQAARLGYRDICLKILERGYLFEVTEENPRFPDALKKNDLENMLIELVKVGKCPEKFNSAWAEINAFPGLAKVLHDNALKAEIKQAADQMLLNINKGIEKFGVFAEIPKKPANDRRFTSEVKIEEKSEKPLANDRSFKPGGGAASTS